MLSEFKLNSVYYKPYKGQLPTQTLANQMASKVGQGQSKYGDLTTWSAWIQDNWDEGVGKLKPGESGGFLYGEVESRVPSQLILPQLLTQTDTRDTDGTRTDSRYIPQDIAGFFTLVQTVSASTMNSIAMPLRTPASLPHSEYVYWVYADVPAGATSINFSLSTDSAGAPGSSVAFSNETFTLTTGSKGLGWYGIVIDAALSTSTNYWLVVSPTSPGTMRVAYGNTGFATNSYASINGSFVAQASKYGLYSTNLHTLRVVESDYNDDIGLTGSGFFRFNGNLYCYVGIEDTPTVYKYDTTNDQWDSVGTITDHRSVTSAVVFDNNVYFGNGGLTTTDYTTMSTSEVFTSTGLNGYLFAKSKGILWRAYLNYVEYSSDGTTWEPTATFLDPIYVSDTSAPVLGMCAMGDNMYVSTKEGLVAILPGDVVQPVMEWGSVDTLNGTCMVNFEGSLYITVGGRVVRVTEDGSQQDVWVTRDDDFLSGRIGRVWHLCKTNNWLIAIVGGVVSGLAFEVASPTVWAYQNNSWHYVASLPTSYDSMMTELDYFLNYNVYYDRTTQYLWCVTPSSVTFKLYIPDYSINPFNDLNATYRPTGWVEWDWFDSPVQEAPKDYESVTIIGENFSSTQYAEVYWKDDASTDWESLGTVDSNSEELRWTVAMGTRPNTRRFKLGILLVSLDGDETPRVRAIRVKYHLMVRDWFRWNLSIDVSGRSGAYQMLADGTRNNLTAVQIKDNIDALAKQVPPFIYQDLDSTQYEVKITDANFQYTRWEYNDSTTDSWWEGVYNIVLEQITNSEYTP